MVLTSTTHKYFARLSAKISRAKINSPFGLVFEYDKEDFFNSYKLIYEYWVKKRTQKYLVENYNLCKKTLLRYETNFANYGAIGLFPDLSFVQTESKLEELVILIKQARIHENSSLALRLADALEIKGASLDVIRQIQRSYGYGQKFNSKDIEYFARLQHILSSIECLKQKANSGHGIINKKNAFYNYDKDILQHRIELFKTLSVATKKRQILPMLTQYGMHPNRFYQLKSRYEIFGIWGLVNLVQGNKKGDKISPKLELQIIEQRLMNPKLSVAKTISKLDLKCSNSNVQKIYSKWGLSRFRKAVKIRGVISVSIPDRLEPIKDVVEKSAKSRMPDLIEINNLKVNNSFSRLINTLSYKKISISNPGAFIIAPFLDQLGVVEALYTYGTNGYRGKEITNDIIINVLRIVAGFPTLNDFSLNSDRSVAIGAGLTTNPKSSKLYEEFDELRFAHLQNLRNDASKRAMELGIFEAKEVAIDYHCDASDSRYPDDKSLTRAPDKNGNMVYAHRPQILWDSVHNTIINIAYCQGQSRATSALYNFCEQNLYKIVDKEAINEIYADSEYTGEKQLVYLIIRSNTDVTMCLKQNKRIQKWREETIRNGKWQDFENKYQIVSRDFTLTISQRPFRFIVKREKETGNIRCFGSTHIDYCPEKILNSYHIRWPVETGIKELIEGYFLNKPTGTSPEKIELHYYCVMLAKLAIDYFLSLLCEPKWNTAEGWKCVLSTIRTTIFSNQNCELSLDDKGNLLITYLDGDSTGIKKNLADMLEKNISTGLNKVSWWGKRSVRIAVKNQFDEL